MTYDNDNDNDTLLFENNPVYGSDKTKRPKNMLSFRKADNTACHIPYFQIVMVDESNNDRITVYTHPRIIHIEGENLRPIAERIKHGSLSYIRESNRTNPVYSSDGVAVVAIGYEG